MDYTKTLEFAKSMMMNQEIKSNNPIEGIKDALSEKEKRKTINLFHGYQYILTHKRSLHQIENFLETLTS